MKGDEEEMPHQVEQREASPRDSVFIKRTVEHK